MPFLPIFFKAFSIRSQPTLTFSKAISGVTLTVTAPRELLIPIRLPTGELTGCIGITEGKVPKEFHLSNVVTFPKKTA